MRKLLMTACFLLAALALQLASRPGTANGQAGLFRVLSSSYVAVGESIYRLDFLNAPVGWHQMPYLNFTLPPVPASSLVSLDGDVAITEAGEGWVRTSLEAGGWASAGQVPGTVSVQRSNWGALKARYR